MEDIELAVEVLIDLQNACVVSTAVTVVHCRPNGHQVLFGEPVLVSFHHQLMSACNQVKSVKVVELRSDLTSKEPASSAG